MMAHSYDAENPETGFSSDGVAAIRDDDAISSGRFPCYNADVMIR